MKAPAGLVIGGGGVAGIAWALGVLDGLVAGGVDPRGFERIVGTSAGATVGVQLATGCLSLAVAAQAEPCAEIPVHLVLEEYDQQLQAIVGDARGDDARRRIGRFALEASVPSAETRRAIVAARLPVQTWPDWELDVVTVDVDTGSVVVLDRHGDVSLVDAVTASCAVPGVWPVVEVNGRRLMDGGMRSATNADLVGPSDLVRSSDRAGSSDRVVVIAPARLPERARLRLDREVGVRANVVIVPDAASADALGPSPFDPSTRPAALGQGRRQGRESARSVARLLARVVVEGEPTSP